MNIERHVRLFRNGKNQALRIPRDMELPGSEAIIRKEGGHLVLEPVETTSLLALLAGWGPLEDEFPDIDENMPPLDDIAI